jgi:hypothetical protein
MKHLERVAAIAKEAQIAFERMEARFEYGHVTESQIRKIARRVENTYERMAARKLAKKHRIYV